MEEYFASDPSPGLEAAGPVGTEGGVASRSEERSEARGGREEGVAGMGVRSERGW
jgi:hypothetical protein